MDLGLLGRRRVVRLRVQPSDHMMSKGQLFHEHPFDRIGWASPFTGV